MKNDENEGNGGREGPSVPRSALSAMWHGLGLFGESYLLFSVGILRPLWEELYPSCFDEDDPDTCRYPILSYKSITYSVVLGVMAGMVVIGALANEIGRRRGSILTALLMSVGAVCLTLSSVILSSFPSALFPAMSISLFVFGVGVGGEYPLSASSASERAMAVTRERRQREVDDCKQKMKRLPTSEANEERPSSGADGKKRQPHVDTGSGAANPSWQTLSTPKRSNNEGEEVEGNIPPVVKESYGDVPLSPTNVTGGTGGSLGTYETSLRTRGREVLLVFSMQGMGIFANSLMLSFLLLVTRRRGDKDANDGQDDVGDGGYVYETSTLLNIWRATYATGTAVLIYVLVSRISHVTESEVWAQDRELREEERKERQTRKADVGYKEPRIGPHKREMKREEKRERDSVESGSHEPVISPTMSSVTMRSEFDLLGSTNLDGCRMVTAVMEVAEDDDGKGGSFLSREVVLLFRHYGARLFGTSMTWLLWDVAFYGNKLFQSSFLIALTGEDASLLQIAGASALNAFISLLGYYAAAAIVDDPDCGRLTLQQTGFQVTGTLFLLCGLLNERLSSTWLVTMYLLSSFFGQCGPNCTTFLIPAEVFPTNMRSMCHGISASAGKFGALIASVLFNFVDERDLFLISGYASFAASVITFLTIPETTTLDLYEIDKQWHKAANDESYEGPAADPRHLSFYERNQNKLFCGRK